MKNKRECVRERERGGSEDRDDEQHLIIISEWYMAGWHSRYHPARMEPFQIEMLIMSTKEILANLSFYLSFYFRYIQFGRIDK